MLNQINKYIAENLTIPPLLHYAFQHVFLQLSFYSQSELLIRSHAGSISPAAANKQCVESAAITEFEQNLDGTIGEQIQFQVVHLDLMAAPWRTC
jgi:hypothetical protein